MSRPRMIPDRPSDLGKHDPSVIGPVTVPRSRTYRGFLNRGPLITAVLTFSVLFP